MKRSFAMAFILPVLTALTACGGGGTFFCADPERYTGSATIQPIRVPDGLSPPDDSQALVVPPASGRALDSDATGRPCLQAPPDYLESRPSSGEDA